MLVETPAAASASSGIFDCVAPGIQTGGPEAFERLLAAQAALEVRPTGGGWARGLVSGRWPSGRASGAPRACGRSTIAPGAIARCRSDRRRPATSTCGAPPDAA